MKGRGRGSTESSESGSDYAGTVVSFTFNPYRCALSCTVLRYKCALVDHTQNKGLNHRMPDIVHLILLLLHSLWYDEDTRI